MSTPLRVIPEELRARASSLGTLREQTRQTQEILMRAWNRLDAGWEDYAESGIQSHYSKALSEIGRMVAMLEQMNHALMQSADELEAADKRMATLFAPEAGGTGTPPGGSFAKPPQPPGVDGTSEEGAVFGPIAGDLFYPGGAGEVDETVVIHPSDITQGNLGDCYFLSALAAIARYDPDAIRKMIRPNPNGDGSYIVTFYELVGYGPIDNQPVYVPREVTVTADFPLNSSGDPVFAKPEDAGAAGQELWVLLMEKAYAQYHYNNYHAIEGGWGNIAMEVLTGVPSQTNSADNVTIDDLANQFNTGAITVASLTDWKIGSDPNPLWDIPDETDTNLLYQNGTIVPSHEYYVTAVDVAAGTITLHNPWGWDQPAITVTYDQFRAAFGQVSFNPTTQAANP